MTDILEQKYKERCEEPSDIYEHLPTLRAYASQCNHVTECGVRTVVSSYAFATALSQKSNTKLIMVDPSKHPHSIDTFLQECKNANLNSTFYEQSDLTCPMEKTDLLFIDTWHVYGQLKRELNRWHEQVNKYIVMHDTTVDEWEGESKRCGMPVAIQTRETGIPIEEIYKGLWPAIEEFIQQHPEWKIKERFTNNNGLTILERSYRVVHLV